MTYRFTQNLSIDAAFGTTVRLAEIESHRALLQRSGIYVLHEMIEITQDFSPYLSTTLYIGKAIGETIYSRCRKHRQAIAEHGLAKGKAKMKPGKRFQEYRASTAHLAIELFVTASFLDRNEPYIISCTEEYLLHTYEKLHGHKPRANTK